MAEENKEEKRTYTQNLMDINSKLGKLETIAGYQENHLQNIDSHLETQNNRIGRNENRLTALETTQKAGCVSRDHKIMGRLWDTGKSYGGSILIIGAVIAITYYVGCAFGWWG